MSDLIGLHTLLDDAERHIRRVLLEKKEPELVPMFVMATKRGGIILCPTPWRNDEEKRLMIEALRREMRKEGAEAYCFMSEAWTAVQPKGWKPGDSEGPAASHRPDRQEIVFALAADRERTIQRQWRIVRGEAGTIVKLDLDKEPPDAIVGRMSELLR
jgi:hypothetical protein